MKHNFDQWQTPSNSLCMSAYLNFFNISIVRAAQGLVAYVKYGVKCWNSFCVACSHKIRTPENIYEIAYI